MGCTVCAQGSAEMETPNLVSFQSLYKEQRQREKTPGKEAEKKSIAKTLGLSAETADTELSAASAEKLHYERQYEEYLTQKDRSALYEKTK